MKLPVAELLFLPEVQLNFYHQVIELVEPLTDDNAHEYVDRGTLLGPANSQGPLGTKGPLRLRLSYFVEFGVLHFTMVRNEGGHDHAGYEGYGHIVLFQEGKQAEFEYSFSPTTFGLYAEGLRHFGRTGKIDRMPSGRVIPRR